MRTYKPTWQKLRANTLTRATDREDQAIWQTSRHSELGPKKFKPRTTRTTSPELSAQTMDAKTTKSETVIRSGDSTITTSGYELSKRVAFDHQISLIYYSRTLYNDECDV
eukprot:GHVP01036302.1.p2 GENE.GHVP01036302.1~~GHVP01036302.1.p2  ORF type:complete len:110 (-),score=5.00 GHVP01036302.1:72-401(-)